VAIGSSDLTELLRDRGGRLAVSLESFLHSSAEELHQAVVALSSGTVFLCGNGGSAALAAHLEAELVGRYRDDRRPLPALYLGLGSPSSTAIINDFGDIQAFVRPLRALARRGDGLLAISTSGTSPNVLAALAAARELGVRSVLLTGPNPGDADADVVLRFPGARTDFVQDGHQLIVHALMDAIEAMR
jgi:D-sedoheptulose 7-phosphate isomerase